MKKKILLLFTFSLLLIMSCNQGGTSTTETMDTTETIATPESPNPPIAQTYFNSYGIQIFENMDEYHSSFVDKNYLFYNGYLFYEQIQALGDFHQLWASTGAGTYKLKSLGCTDEYDISFAFFAKETENHARVAACKITTDTVKHFEKSDDNLLNWSDSSNDDVLYMYQSNLVYRYQNGKLKYIAGHFENIQFEIEISESFFDVHAPNGIELNHCLMCRLLNKQTATAAYEELYQSFISSAAE